MIVRTARDLGAAIRDARRARGWTQAEFAAELGTSRQWIIAVERGKATAEIGMVLRAVRALGLAVEVGPAPKSSTSVDLDELLDDLRG